MSKRTFSQICDDNINNNDGGDSKRKLHFAICTPTADQIREHFSRFGEVESVEMNDHDGFVKFKMIEGAENALQPSGHPINNQINVGKLYDSPQPESKLLNMLGDDCMRSVFKCLQLKDLCNAAEVCVRFKQNADEQFKSRYTNLSTTTELFVDGQFDLKFVEQLLRNFGPLIRSVCVRDDGTEIAYAEDDEEIWVQQVHDRFLFLLNKYCAGTLKKLNLRDFKGQLCSSFCPMFAGLKELNINLDSLYEDSAQYLLSSCSELTSLAVRSKDSHVIRKLLVKFPKLIELVFEETGYLTDRFLNDMMRLNRNIMKLVIYFRYDFFASRVSSTVFKHIAKRLPNLRTLTIGNRFVYFGEEEWQIKENLLHLSELKSLKQLKIDCIGFSINPLIVRFVEAEVPLEYLRIFYGTINLELLNSLSVLATFRELELFDTEMIGVSLVDVAKCLPMLTGLYLNCMDGMIINDVMEMLPFATNLRELDLTFKNEQVHIDDDTLTSISKIVQKRGDSTKLVINVREGHAAVSQSLIQQNRHWIEIKDIY